MDWEKNELSCGLLIEGDLPEDLDYGVVTSNSLIQLLFHYPFLLLRRRVMIEQCRFFGKHECFWETKILRELVTILLDDPLIYFFLEVRHRHWSLAIEAGYEGDLIEHIEKICKAYYNDSRP
jgi:hypothetical protein